MKNEGVDANLITPEKYGVSVRLRVLSRLRGYFDNQFRDADLLYLGARYAASLGMESEVKRFLEPLEKCVSQNNGGQSYYEALGLLSLAVTSDENRRTEIKKRLSNIKKASPGLEEAWKQLFDAGDSSFNHVEKLMHPNDSERAALIERYLQNSYHLNNVQIMQQLASRATQAYYRRNIAEARCLLEEMLLKEGDQPDILLNLITITSEQQDIEGYERYWRRYVRVLLGHIMRGDDAECAWQDLSRFYTRVSEQTELELGKYGADVSPLLCRLGFLPRWLEANAALIWIENIGHLAYPYQTTSGETEQKYLEVRQYWFHLFYPEFEPWVNSKTNGEHCLAFPNSQTRPILNFDPTVRFVKHFLEWTRIGFAIPKDSEPAKDIHVENIVALAHMVARLPLALYYSNQELIDTISVVKDLERKSVRQHLQGACSFPFYAFRFNNFLEKGEFEKIVTEFDHPGLADHLNPTLRMFLAFSTCREGKEEKGLQLAVKTLPEFNKEDMVEGGQNANLWNNILHANVAQSIHAQRLPSGSILVINSLDKPRAYSIDKETANLLEAIQEMLERGQYKMARKFAEKISNAVVKVTWVSYIDNTKKQKDVIRSAWKDFIRDQIAQLSGDNWLVSYKAEALKFAEDTLKEQLLIPEVIENSQLAAQENNFILARQEIGRLPDDPEEIQKLKKDLLKQVQEAEEQHGLQKQVDEAMERLKGHMQNGNYYQAKNVVNALPNHPALSELKSSLLSQINQVEQQNKQIENTIDQIKTSLQYGNFNVARQIALQLPPELQQNILSQINQVEQQNRYR